MALPMQTHNPIAYFDMNDGFVNQAYGTNSLISVVNQMDGTALSQTTGANRPTFNLKGITTSRPALKPAMQFAGSQYMFDNTVAGLIGADKNFTVCCVAACSAPTSGTALSMFGLGNSATGTFLSLEAKSSDIQLRGNSNGNSGFTATASLILDTKPHVFVVVRNGQHVTVRVDGVQKIDENFGGGQVYTLNTFTVGALNSNNVVSVSYTGDIGLLAVYPVALLGYKDLEEYLIRHWV